MEPNETSVADELTNFISNLLPKKKTTITQLLRTEPAPECLSDIHARAKGVYPDCFAGAKIATVREVGGKFKLSQQYDYRYKKVADRSFAHFLYKESEPKVQRSDVTVDTRGSATVDYREELDDGLSVRVSSKIKDVTSSEVEMSVARAAGDGCGSVALSAVDVDPHSLRLVAQYLHGVTRELSVGAEVTTSPFSACARPELTLSARYRPTHGSLSATVGKNGFQICFFKRLSSRLKFASIVDYGNYSDRTTVSLAIQNNIGVDSRLKTFVDSNQTGGFNFEKDVFVRDANSDPSVLKVVGSMLIDRQRRVEFGLGFFMDL